jgi:internalin A
MSNVSEDFVAAFEYLKAGSSQLLHPGASKTRIADLERKLGAKFPESLRELYSKFNGEIPAGPGLGAGALFGYQFISLEQVQSVHDLFVMANNIRKLEDQESLTFQSVPPGCIKDVFFDPLWIPIAGFYDGAHLAVDLNPGSNGVVGQIINFGRDDRIHFQLSRSLEDLLKIIIQCYQLRRMHYYFEDSDWHLYRELLETGGVIRPVVLGEGPAG